MRNFLLFCQGFSKKVEKVIPAKTRAGAGLGKWRRVALVWPCRVPSC